MPRAPRKCPTPGCDNRITNTRYCPQHTVWNWPNKQRPSTHKIWARTILTRDKHQCQIRGPHCTGTATIADHLIPTAEGGRDVPSNGQAACQACSNEKTQREAHRGLLKAYGHDTTEEKPPF